MTAETIKRGLLSYDNLRSIRTASLERACRRKNNLERRSQPTSARRLVSWPADKDLTHLMFWNHCMKWLHIVFNVLGPTTIERMKRPHITTSLDLYGRRLFEQPRSIRY